MYVCVSVCMCVCQGICVWCVCVCVCGVCECVVRVCVCVKQGHSLLCVGVYVWEIGKHTALCVCVYGETGKHTAVCVCEIGKYTTLSVHRHKPGEFPCVCFLSFPFSICKEKRGSLGTSLVGQWFRPHAPNAGEMDPIPGGRTKIPHCKKKKKPLGAGVQSRQDPGGTLRMNGISKREREDTWDQPW